MNLLEMLKELCGVYSVSGRESPVAKTVKRLASQYADEVKTDRLGNVLAVKRGMGENLPLVLIDAHMDEIGMSVTSVTGEGFLKFGNLTGIDESLLLAHEVVVHAGEPLFGVVSTLPPHLQKKGDDRKEVSSESLVIDVGLPFERAKELIRPGTPITLRGGLTELKNGRVAGRALDNRVGVAVMLRTMRLLKDAKLGIDVVYMASVQEERGLKGAGPGAYGVKPDLAVVLDVTYAEFPGCDPADVKRLGGGPAIGIAPVLDRGIFAEFGRLAEREGIAYQVEAMSGNTGTNAYTIHSSGDGVRTGLLSVPIRNMHSAAEVVSLSDMDGTVKLLSSYLVMKGGSER